MNNGILKIQLLPPELYENLWEYEQLMEIANVLIRHNIQLSEEEEKSLSEWIKPKRRRLKISQFKYIGISFILLNSLCCQGFEFCYDDELYVQKLELVEYTETIYDTVVRADFGIVTAYLSYNDLTSKFREFKARKKQESR